MENVPCKFSGTEPGGHQKAFYMAVIVGHGIFNEIDSILFYLHGADQHAEARITENIHRWEAFPIFVMPITKQNVLGNHLQGFFGVVGGGFVFSVAGFLGIEEAVAPHQHLRTALGQVVVKGVDPIGKKLVVGVFGTFGAQTDVENFVASHVHGIGFEYVQKLVHQIEHKKLDQGVGQAKTAAVKYSLLIGQFIQFGVSPKQAVTEIGNGFGMTVKEDRVVYSQEGL